MHFIAGLIFAVELASALALPKQQAPAASVGSLTSLQGLSASEISALLGSLQNGQNVQNVRERPAEQQQAAQGGRVAGEAKGEGKGKGAGAGEAAQEGEGEGAGAGAEAAEGAGEGEGEGEGEGAANEVEIEGAFDTPAALQGGDLKQDVVFTPSTVGSFEYEFQSAAADTLTVTENTAPAAAPAGFVAIEPNSYVVALSDSKGAGLTLSKIDYIFDAANPTLAGVDITQAQVGKLCSSLGAFVISETLGELEFELEENEVTLNLNKNVTAEGEWGIFLPAAAVATAFSESMKEKPAAAPAVPAAKEAPAAKEE